MYNTYIWNVHKRVSKEENIIFDPSCDYKSQSVVETDQLTKTNRCLKKGSSKFNEKITEIVIFLLTMKTYF